jgi:hypothetical protein
MTIFNQFKHGVDITKFKADQLLRINRVQSEIDSLRPEITDIKLQIGETAYSLHQQGQLQNTDLQELCRDIDEVYQQIAEKERQIGAIREEKPPQGPQVSQPSGPLCQTCHNPYSKGALFCMHCGSPVPKTCPQCGTLIPDNARFCISCGLSTGDQNQAPEQDIPS